MEGNKNNVHNLTYFPPIFCPISQNILQNITWNDQENLLNATLNAEILIRHNLPITYRISFLRYIINALETQNIEIHDAIYELYVSLLDDQELPNFSYKHYRLLQYNNKTITIKEARHMITDGTTGLHCWQAAGALAEWAIANAERIRNKQCLELGSGTGLTGFILAKICEPKKLILTDGNDLVLNLLQNNYEVNFDKNTDKISIEMLDWENIRQSTIMEKIVPDIILAADVVYDSSLFVPLCHTLDFIFTKCENKCTFILTCTVRNDDTLNDFIRLMG